MKRELVYTDDGSTTWYLPEMGEHYHSTFGAIQESLHIYIEQGLLHTKTEEISVLEIGFGTGLNAYLSYCFATQNNLSIKYLSLEKYPLDEEEISLLNYPANIFSEHALAFSKIHKAEWNEWADISPEFRIKKVQADLITHQFGATPQFDLVYYDAFAPAKQPEMWSDEVLQKVAETVKKDGILVTYCAKGTVRRSLASAGFAMERIPGPPGKKEILRGKKTF
jgi:tRNA U34 5-methylaminomethyl-2-thiouridine-forming methyltransferase MnmC